jgi:hypothetical protein
MLYPPRRAALHCVHMTNYMKLAAASGLCTDVNDAEQRLFDGNWRSSLQHTEYVACQGI